jgi:hypothetical protein
MNEAIQSHPAPVIISACEFSEDAHREIRLATLLKYLSRLTRKKIRALHDDKGCLCVDWMNNHRQVRLPT